MSKIRRAELKAEADRKNGFKPDLPDSVNLIDRDLSMLVWRVMRLCNWQWLPSQILNEPEWVLNDIIAIQSAYSVITEVIDK